MISQGDTTWKRPESVFVIAKLKTKVAGQKPDLDDDAVEGGRITV
ncbi:hypothetical protein [Acidihalobacter prosperus]